MELREVIRCRRSIRRYEDRAVPRAVLEQLLEDACWAPSAENYQPWHFVALTKPEEIAQLRKEGKLVYSIKDLDYFFDEMES